MSGRRMANSPLSSFPEWFWLTIQVNAAGAAKLAYAAASKSENAGFINC
jgi:hypothetical protein